MTLFYVVDSLLPEISNARLTSTAPNENYAKASALLTLEFTVTDTNVLPATSLFTILINGETRTVVSSTVLDTVGKSKKLTFTWTVPASPSMTTVGYSITVLDVAGNARTQAVANVITIGMFA